MGNIIFHCPICQTQYRVQGEQINSTKPHFQCRSCDSVFCFTYPFLTEPSYEIIKTQSQKQRGCPKCGAQNPLEHKECYSCGVIMQKVPLNHEDFWSKILNDFQNPRLHQEFLDLCQRLGRLDYAFERYTILLSAQGGKDEFCEVQIQRIENLLGDKSKSKTFHQKVTLFAKKLFSVNWNEIGGWGVLVLAGLIMTGGLLVPGYRNLVGLGVFILILRFGAWRAKKVRTTHK